VLATTQQTVLKI